MGAARAAPFFVPPRAKPPCAKWPHEAMTSAALAILIGAGGNYAGTNALTSG
jgi:hypothetical protein